MKLAMSATVIFVGCIILLLAATHNLWSYRIVNDGIRQTYIGAFGHPPRAPRDGIAELKSLARTKKLHYRIFCTDVEIDPSWQFLAELCETDCRLIYAEEGAGKSWTAHGSSQIQAAVNLVDKVLSGEHSKEPMRREPPRMQHRQCPSPIEG